MSESFVFTPKGVCSKQFTFEIENDVIQNLTVSGGCNGNLKGISRLVQGRTIQEIVEALEGIQCGFRDTSCPDQIAKALNDYQLNK